jgi:hypothetical protein
MRIYTKKNLIKALIEIRDMGWIPSARPGNAGSVGNTLEDLLGIEENNLPLPNAAEWELKCQRAGTTALTTLFHMEPSPRAISIVSNILLPKYGWPHDKAGERYPENEKSFRQTIHAQSRSSRGFKVIIDRDSRKVMVSFDSSKVSPENHDWLKSVERRIGLGEINPQPYWGFDDLFHKAGTKLLNCFYVQAERKKIDGIVHFHYSSIQVLQGMQLDGFLEAMEKGYLYVDFDARTGHNHGTKFRLRKNMLSMLYEKVLNIDSEQDLQDLGLDDSEINELDIQKPKSLGNPAKQTSFLD